MNEQFLIDRLTHALTRPDRGVVGLVDELLAVASQSELELTWIADRCQITLTTANPPEQVAGPMPRSVVRAILARIAALCKESHPDSVSPYRGRGEVAFETDPTIAIAVQFENTTDQQSLTLTARSARTARQAASA